MILKGRFASKAAAANTAPGAILARFMLYVCTTAAEYYGSSTTSPMHMAIDKVGDLVGDLVQTGLMLAWCMQVGEVMGKWVWVAWYPDPAGGFVSPAGVPTCGRITLRTN